MNTDYEQALLGAVLQGFKDVPALSRIVSESDFRQPRDGQIWQAILAVHEAGNIPDALTVRAQLGSLANHLPKGPVYLTELDAPVVAQAPFYAEKVREGSIRRQIAGLGMRCRQIEEDLDTDVGDMLSHIREWAAEIHVARPVSGCAVSAALEQVIDVAERGELAATPTPWSDLNNLLGGWYPGQLVIIGARPGVGKSIALENAATDVARTHKRRVAFISLEMSAKEITQRTLAHTAKVELTRIRRGRDWLTETDWEFINHAHSLISETPIRFYDEPNQTLDDIRAAAWETKQEAARNGEQLGLVVVDYLQLITPRDRRISRQQQVGEMSRGLKNLAKELDVPVLAGAQLNRASVQRANPVPVLSDLREAGDIEQDSDVVLFLHEEYVEDGGRFISTGNIQVIAAKQRHGPLGAVDLQKHGHYARIA
jgi:replicative DNA helicase